MVSDVSLMYEQDLNFKGRLINIGFGNIRGL